MEEKRELLLKASRQLKAVSDFLENIEKAMSISVETKALELQLRTVLESTAAAHETIRVIHDESVQLLTAEQKERETLTSEIQQLKEKVQQLSSLNEELQKPKKRKTKSK